MPLGEMRLRGIPARGPEQDRRSPTSTASCRVAVIFGLGDLLP